MTEWAIFGCGYVGTRLARRLLAEGHSVRAFSRHPEKLADLAALGARVQAIDATKSRQFGPALHGARSPVVVYSIPSQGNMPGGVPVRRAGDAAMAVGARRFIYLSSTAVYGPTSEGEVVDEDSSLALSDGDAILRIADESAVQGIQLSGLATVVLRLAAVYGPGRGVRERLKAGTYKLIDEGEHMFSRVHVDDVVGVIQASVERAPNPAVYCVADDRPTTQKEYADWLVARMGATPPISVPSLAPGKPRRPVRNRAVSNKRLKSELGYVLRYPTFLEGEPAIEAEQGSAPVAVAVAPPPAEVVSPLAELLAHLAADRLPEAQKSVEQLLTQPPQDPAEIWKAFSAALARQSVELSKLYTSPFASLAESLIDLDMAMQRFKRATWFPDLWAVRAKY